MSQEEIDAMLAGLSGEPAAVSPQATPPAAPAPKPAAPPAPMMVDQDELDRLMDSLQADASSEVESAVAAAPAAAPSGPLGQNDIDAILAGLEASAAPAAPVSVDTNSDSPLGQSDIDALLASMAGDMPAAESPKPVTKPVTKPVAKPAPTGDSPLGQGDIDDLLRSLEAASAPEVMPSAPAAAVDSVAKEMPAGKLGQDDIDTLLNNLGAEQISVGAKKVGESSKSDLSKAGLSKTNLSRGSLALTSEDLTALVTKHSAPPAAGGEAEGMIDQEDIDALVKQLGAVSGPGDADPGAKPSMTEELAKHDAAIDELLGGQKPSANAVTMDAIDVRGLDRPPSTSNNERPTGGRLASGPTFTVPVLTPPELRGARWLLAAAVLLLGVCAGTLVVVASALRTLGGELAHERLAALEPGEDYGDDFKAAVARLTAPDEQEAAKGVLFLTRLKKRYPSHEAEVALVLARHFRSLGAWQEADREYASLPDEVIDDDPRVTLERADTLRQLHDVESARRHLYHLLANEARHLAQTTPPRPADISERNRRTLIEAHLMLGRLLDATSEPTVASAESDEHPAAHAPATVTDEAGHAPAHASEGHH